MNDSENIKKRILFTSPLLLLLGYWIWKTGNLPLHDFSNAYIGAVFLKEDWWTALVYDALEFNSQASEKGFSELFLAYYPNTPFLAFFFYPFAFLSPMLAKILFNILSSALLFFALVRAQKRWQIAPWVLFLLPIVFFTSLRNGLYFGQVYFLLFFLLVEGTVAFQEKKNWLGAFCWGTALMLKVFPVLLGVFLWIEKRYKALLLYIVVCAVWLGGSLLQVDLASWWYYFTEVLPKSAEGAYYDGFTPAAKSATMLFKNLFVYDELHNPTPILNSYHAYILAQAIYKTSIISIVIIFTWKSSQDLLNKLGLWIIACMLLSPGLSSYASILLLYPWLLVCKTQRKLTIKSQLIFTILVAFYANIPITYFYNSPLFLKFPKVYLLFIVFVAYYQLMKEEEGQEMKPMAKLGLSTGLFLLFSIPSLLKSHPPENDYVLAREEQILTIDYEVTQGNLQYEYWTVPAPKKAMTELIVTSFDASSVHIQNGQVYYKNKALTNTKSNKRKPMLINDKEVFYLSDQNRGIGFYTLMKINLKEEK